MSDPEDVARGLLDSAVLQGLTDDPTSRNPLIHAPSGTNDSVQIRQSPSEDERISTSGANELIGQVQPREDQETAEAIEGQAGGAAQVVDHGPAGTQSVERVAGTPHTDRRQLRQQWREAGRVRVDALTRTFGEDALILGHLLFNVPPQAIRVRKGNISYRWKPLRTNESLAIKSGNGECWIEIDIDIVGLDQINRELVGLVSLFKRIPFCPIENSFIRGQIIPDNPEDAMAVCLHTMVGDVMSGKPDTVNVTLMLQWFNYKPYSQNFWLRRRWSASNQSQPPILQEEVPREETNPFSLEGVLPEESVMRNQRQVDVAREGTIVNLEAIQSPEGWDQALPPEVGLSYPQRTEDPSDPTIEPTHPVIYAFNSLPFIQRVTTNLRHTTNIDSWTDGLSMRWNSFVRVNVPSRWARIDDTREAEVPGSAEEGPPRIEGEDRKVILFIGDNTTAAYLGISANASFIFNRYTGQRFQRDGEYGEYEYHYLVKNQAFASQMKTAFEDAIANRPELTTEGSEDRGNRLAAVILMGGTYDPVGSEDSFEAAKNNLESITNTAIEAGAICLWVTPPPFYGVQQSVVPTDNYLNMARLCTNIMENGSTRSNDRLVTVNSHVPLSSDSSRFTNIYLERYQETSGSDVLPYPNDDGGRHLAEYIHGNLPWNSLQDEPQNGAEWTVCSVHDGDTITAYQGNTAKRFRLKYIDTLETYAADGYPEGQDTGRPSDEQWGRLAKERLIELIGYPNNNVVEIEQFGTGTYDRTLGIIRRGGDNLNLQLVREGYAFAYASSDDDPDQYSPYQEAYIAAQSEGLNIHNRAQESGIPTEPHIWRDAHPFTGGSGDYHGTIEDCPPS